MEEGKEMTREVIWVHIFILNKFNGIIMAFLFFFLHWNFSSAIEPPDT